MTPKEFQAATRAFARHVGPRAEITTSISHESGGALKSSFYTNWPMGDPAFKVQADTFAELFPAIEARWAAYQNTHREKTIRAMALEIIRITAEHGACTDAALRGVYQFSDDDVTTYGALACEDANAIAGNGPFSIVVNGGANAPGLENVERDAAAPLQ